MTWPEAALHIAENVCDAAFWIAVIYSTALCVNAFIIKVL